MAFCSFSKDCDDNSFVTVESRFITKYLPEADGFAVKVYLYGLYLCKNVDADFSVASMAEVLKCSKEQITDAFAFWEDYDLVQILSKDPFAVEYLPVRTASGKPKKAHYERYADFNKELQRKMGKVGKFISAGDYVKYMRFLEETAIQPQALLLVAEYCINKQGENVSPSYIFNKAKKLLKVGCTTYEQVERELSSYNTHEGDLALVISALGGFKRTPDENDYSLFRKWTETLGFTKEGVVTVAKKVKRGSMNALDITLEELYEKGKTEVEEIAEYLDTREQLTGLTFRIARKLGVKISNPATYVDEYVEKWYTYGFEDSSLLDVALFCLKTSRGSFDAMNAVINKLFACGTVSHESVKAFLKEQNEDLKLFDKLCETCGTIRKNATNLSLVRTWKDWNFNEEMILEAGRRSCGSASPIPYMNKILSDWKHKGIFEIKNIPENTPVAVAGGARGYINPAIDAVNAKADRERYYALLREKAQTRVDKVLAKANGNVRFKEVGAELSMMEIALAKAEVFDPKKLPSLQEKKNALLAERKELLAGMGLHEEDLSLQFTCKKCSDTGFLPSGKACDCYKKENF